MALDVARAIGELAELNEGFRLRRHILDAAGAGIELDRAPPFQKRAPYGPALLVEHRHGRLTLENHQFRFAARFEV